MWARSTAWLSEGRQQKPSITTTFSTGVLLLQRSRERSPSIDPQHYVYLSVFEPHKTYPKIYSILSGSRGDDEEDFAEGGPEFGFAVPFYGEKVDEPGGLARWTRL